MQYYNYLRHSNPFLPFPPDSYLTAVYYRVSMLLMLYICNRKWRNCICTIMTFEGGKEEYNGELNEKLKRSPRARARDRACNCRCASSDCWVELNRACVAHLKNN